MAGSQSGSDDSNDSRKRQSAENYDIESTSKRPNCGVPTVHLKVLIPSIAAGAVIGKDGEAIERIQKESGAKVKMSKRNDFYPGTLERVCLITGTLEAVTATHTFIMERIYEKPETGVQSADGRLILERHKQAKILVPNSTAGMIIGKNGAYIQEIKERSEAYVQISQKSREFSLLERCVIVAGSLNQIRGAMDIILAVIASDPLSSSCSNVSYMDVRGPVSSVYPTGSPYAFPFMTPMAAGTVVGQPSASAAAFLRSSRTASNAFAAMMNPFLPNQAASAVDPSMLLGLNASDPNRAALSATAFLQQMGAVSVAGGGGVGAVGVAGAAATTPQRPGATLSAPNSLMPFCSSPTFLLSANMFDSLMASAPASTSQYLGVTCPPATSAYPFISLQTASAADTPNSSSSATPIATLQQATLAAAAAGKHPAPSTGHLYDPGHALGEHQHADVYQMSPTALMGLYAAAAAAAASAPAAQIDGSVASMGLPPNPPPSTGGQSCSLAAGYICTRDILVPEHLVSRISGPQGRLLLNLQTLTNTMIQLSPKSACVSGVQNRVISITGEQINVEYAAAIIENPIVNEQLVRQQQQQQLHHHQQQYHRKSSDEETIGVGDSGHPTGSSNNQTANGVASGHSQYGCVEPASPASSQPVPTATTSPAQIQPHAKQPAF